MKLGLSFATHAKSINSWSSLFRKNNFARYRKVKCQVRKSEKPGTKKWNSRYEKVKRQVEINELPGKQKSKIPGMKRKMPGNG
jgi:hypothetical protein